MYNGELVFSKCRNSSTVVALHKIKIGMGISKF